MENHKEKKTEDQIQTGLKLVCIGLMRTGVLTGSWDVAVRLWRGFQPI